MLVEVKKNDEFFINKRLFLGEFNIQKKGITLITGENGVGKSSLFEFLKLNTTSVFGDANTTFLDQKSLIPLNNVCLSRTIENLKPFRKENLLLFDWWMDGLASFSKVPINELSGGQNQMVKVAISLYLGGDYFFFDEPLHFLDKNNREKFVNLLEKLVLEGKSIVMIEHQKSFVSNVITGEYEIFNREHEVGVRRVK